MKELLNTKIPTQVLRKDQEIPSDSTGILCLDALYAKLEDSPLCNEIVFERAQQFAKHTKEHSHFLCVVEKNNPISGALFGLCKTAQQEWEKTQVKCIALDSTNSIPDIAKLLYHETLFGGFENEVIYENGIRKSYLAISKEIYEDHKLHLQREDIVLVTGGGRGITAKCIIKLAKENPCRFLILGRSKLINVDAYVGLNTDQIRQDILRNSNPKPSPRDLQKQVSDILNTQEILQTLERLKSLGCETLYESVDCSHKFELSDAINKARKWWNAPIAGIIHGAGVLHDRLLGDLTLEQYRSVLDTKVKSAQNILSLCESEGLKVICFFSSVAARYGNKGQSTYSMANEILNKLAFAESVKRPHCTVKSIDWGPWKGGMVNEHLKKLFEQRNVGLLDLDEGAQAFVRELDNRSDVEVVIAQKPLSALAHSGIPDCNLDWDYISQKHHLEDHSIKNSKVIPFALILEWALNIAKKQRPELKSFQLSECYCYKGILVPENSSEYPTLQTQVEDSLLTLNINYKNTPHYRVKIHLESQSSQTTVPSLPKKSWNGDIYTEALFHGPKYQVLKSILSLSEEGSEAILELENRSRMLLIDGGIQLAVLWMWESFQLASLPSNIRNLYIYKDNIPSRVKVTLKGSLHLIRNGLVDLYFQSDEGELLAKMEGLLMTSYSYKSSSDHSSDIEAYH